MAEREREREREREETTERQRVGERADRYVHTLFTALTWYFVTCFNVTEREIESVDRKKSVFTFLHDPRPSIEKPKTLHCFLWHCF